MAQKSRIAVLLLIVSACAVSQQESEKCGTFSVVRSISQSRRTQVPHSIIPRPQLQQSILTRNGKIRIHYDTSGINQPALVSVSVLNGAKTVTRIPNSYKQYIDTLRSILDSVWNAEINHFGFSEPPADGNRSGGNEFDIFVLDLGSGLFGVTNIETDLPVGGAKINQQYASFINIDNDFGAGYRTNGIEAVLATTAHEFHHAVQVGGSGVWEDDQFYFYELCAEAMENTVFRDARDYIFDVKTYFKNVHSTSLFQHSTGSINTAGYERAIFAMFLMKKYGTSVMKEIWKEMQKNRPVPALNNTMMTFSTSLQREFSDFTIWNFYTAHRADSVKYYSDAKLFPPVALYRTVNADMSIQTVQMNMLSFAPHYIKAGTPGDSVFFIVSNTDYQDALENTQKSYVSQIDITTSTGSGFPAVSPSLFAQFSSAEKQHWSYNAMGSSAPTVCFPNPMNPSVSSLLISLTGIGSGNDVTLSVISASTMDVIYSNPVQYSLFSGTQYAEWKGRDNEGRLAPSGIYFYLLSKGSTLVKGKFAVIR